MPPDELRQKIKRLVYLEAMSDYLKGWTDDKLYQELLQLRLELIPQINEFIKDVVNAKLISFTVYDEEQKLMKSEFTTFIPHHCIIHDDCIDAHCSPADTVEIDPAEEEHEHEVLDKKKDDLPN